MSDCPLGKPPAQDARRDAIHVPIVPVIAGQKLYPADGIAFNGNGEAIRSDEPLGIVDPFLTRPVLRDERVYVLMNPGSVTQLRHEWDHPGLPSASEDEPDEDDEYDGCNGCY